MPWKRHEACCSNCGAVHQTGRLVDLCNDCLNKHRACSVCGQVKWIRHKIPPRCHDCNRKLLVALNYGQLEKNFRPLTEYNGVLFGLYMKYMRGMAKADVHYLQARQMTSWLETRSIPRLSSWSDIREQSRLFHEKHPYQMFRGRPFVRIGYLLTEIGALPTNYEERAFQIETQMNRISAKQRPCIEKYVMSLRKRRCTNRTIQLTISTVANLFSWLEKRGLVDPFSITVPITEEYLTYLKAERNYKMRSMESFQYTLRRFYEWCRLERLILTNPWSKPRDGSRSNWVTICTEAQFKKLTAFIRSPDSDPEGALLLSLILFYGLTKDDLRFATIKIQDNRLTIVLKRQPRSRGKSFHNRHAEIVWPESSVWCRNLQLRFLRSWKNSFQAGANPLGTPLLLLPKSYLSAKPCGREKVRELVLSLTEKVTGRPIPSNVLRQTCAHIHSMRGDASILTTLGWSRITAFRYSWAPRVFHKSATAN